MDQVLAHIDELAVTQGPDIAKIMDDLREFSANIKQLSEDIKRNPSKLISKPVKSEVVR